MAIVKARKDGNMNWGWVKGNGEKLAASGYKVWKLVVEQTEKPNSTKYLDLPILDERPSCLFLFFNLRFWKKIYKSCHLIHSVVKRLKRSV